MSAAKRPDNPFLTAAEAAAELNVSRPTLYAYVSRGLIRSEPAADGRARLYQAADVRALRGRKTPGTESAAAADGALDFGAPVLASGVTLIDGERCYYRGRDALTLAATASLESVAGLLWQVGSRDPFAQPLPPRPVYDDRLPTIPRLIAALTAAAEEDERGFNLAPEAVARAGARILRLAAATVERGTPAKTPIHRQLVRAFTPDPGPEPLLRSALVLLADHELNASTFTVRCVASTGASPYASVIGGLAALSGPRHGGQAEQVRALYNETLLYTEPRAMVAQRLRRGDSFPGFGHRLYPAGDPRARVLLDGLRAAGYGDGEVFGLLDAVVELTDLQPNIDFALFALTRGFGMADDTPLAIFATARIVGWIAHAMEQYADGRLIRPRARYVGEVPQPRGRKL